MPDPMPAFSLIDTHCHLNLNAFDADRQAVVERATTAGVTRIIIPAVDRVTGDSALALAVDHPGIFAAVGIHPTDTANVGSADFAAIEAQARSSPNVIAIGEIGLDYHWDTSPKAAQFAALEAQLAIAARLGLPVILHNREASEDMIAILRAWVSTLPEPLRSAPGVLHSFSAPAAIADQAIALGFYLGFTGPLTYKNADDLRSISGRVPIDRILVETDSPYLAPQSHRGQRNEPAYVVQVAERLASLRQMDLSAIAAQTSANAERLFTRMTRRSIQPPESDPQSHFSMPPDRPT